jgi:hypothetical protein
VVIAMLAPMPRVIVVVPAFAIVVMPAFASSMGVIVIPSMVVVLMVLQAQFVSFGPFAGRLVL